MKPHDLFTIGCMPLVAFLLGCNQAKPSDMIKTAYLWAYFWIEDSGNDKVDAVAYFKSETEDGEAVDLSNGDSVKCNGSTLEPQDRSYVESEIPRDSNNRYEFVFVREHETISTIVTMPSAPEIVRVIPESGILHPGDTISVFWDATRPEPSLNVYLSGICLDDASSENIPDNGEAIFAPVMKRNNRDSSDCEVSFQARRKRSGSVNSAFRGGITKAETYRSKQLSYVAAH